MNFTRPKLLLSLLLMAVVGLLSAGNVLAQDISVTATNVRPNAQTGHYPILLDASDAGLSSIDVNYTNISGTAATGDFVVSLSISWPDQVGGPLVLTQTLASHTLAGGASETCTFSGTWLKNNLFTFDRRIIYTIDATVNVAGDIAAGNNTLTGRKVAPAFNQAKITLSPTGDFSDFATMGEYITYCGMLGDLEVSVAAGNYSTSSTMSIDGSTYTTDNDYELYIHGTKNYPSYTTIAGVARDRDLGDNWFWHFNQMNVDIKYLTFGLISTGLYNEGGQILNFTNTSTGYYGIDLEGNVFNGYVIPDANTLAFADIYSDGNYLSSFRLYNNQINGGFYSVYMAMDGAVTPVGTDILVSRNSFTNFTSSGVYLLRPAVTSPADYNGGIFTYNTFTTTGFGGSALYVLNMSTIENNTFDLVGAATAEYGVLVLHSATYYPEVLINNNTFTGSGYGAISILDARKSTITNNTIDVDNIAALNAIFINGGGSDIFTNYAHIEKNTIDITTEGNGIFINGAYHKVYYNDIYVESGASATGRYGIYANNSIGIIATNLIQTNFAEGIMSLGLDENIFYNTVIVNGAGNTDAALYINEIGAGLGKTTAKRNMLYNASTNAAAFGITIFAGVTAPIVLDENNYYSEGGNLGFFTGVAADITTWQGMTQTLVALNDVASTEAPPEWITRNGGQVFTYEFYDDDNDSTNVGVYSGTFYNGNLFLEEDPLHAELEMFDFFGTERLGYYAGYTNVQPVAAVVTQPEDIFSCKGEVWQLQCVANVSLNAHSYYQWMKDDVIIAGATEPTLNLDTLDWKHAGKYQCIVSGQGGTAPILTNEVIVVVVGKTSITRQPVDQTGSEHGNVVFEVESHTQGFPPYDPDFPSEIYNPKFQWYKIENGIGVPLTDGSDYEYNVIAGAQSSILSIANLNSTAWGTPIEVYCEILGYCDYTISLLGNKEWNWTRSNTVKVLAPPSLEITAQPESVTECEQKAVSFKVEVAIEGDAEATYQWKKDGLNLTDGSGILGSKTTTLTIDPLEVADAGIYSVDITFMGEVTASNSATLTVDPLPTITSITTGPVAVTAGNPIELVVVADGPGTLTYKWFRDGEEVGTNSATFTVAAAATTDAGDYTCQVTNDCGTIESDPVTVTVTQKNVPDPNSVGEAVAGGFILMTNIPNPFTEATTISFYSPVTTNARIIIADLFGREVASFNVVAIEGLNTVDVNASTSKLTSGAYNYTLEANGVKLTKQMILNR